MKTVLWRRNNDKTPTGGFFANKNDFATFFDATEMMSLKTDQCFFSSTVKPVYNDHPWDPKYEVVLEKWSLFGVCR